MKKSILFVVALAMTFAACQPNYDVEDKTVATFEEAAISPAAPQSYLAFTTDTTALLASGNYELSQTVAYGGTYVTGAVVTNITDTTFKDYKDAYKSIAGGAKGGKNYVVWYEDGFSGDAIKLKTPAVVPGMYVCNNTYAYNSMKYGDAIAGDPFGDDDYLLLHIGGSLDGKVVDTEVEFYLAKGKNIVTEWTYVDLKQLGTVDVIFFSLTGSKTGDWGLNTPTYFCIDNLGAK